MPEKPQISTPAPGFSLWDNVPDNTGRFITLAAASYTAAGQDPYKTKLTKRGYTTTRLTALPATLEDLISTSGTQDEAIDDITYDTLKSLMKELKGTARGTLRRKIGLLAKLGL